MSPSDLKLYSTDLTGFYKQKILGQERARTKPFKGTEIGSMVDVLFTDNANFHNYYVSVEDWKAEGKVKDIVDTVFSRVQAQNTEEMAFQKVRNEVVVTPPVLELHNYDMFIMNAIEEINFQPNWGMPAKMKSVKEKGSDYFSQLKNCNGREMEPFEWFVLAQQKHKAAMEDKHVGKLCRIITGTEQIPGIEVLRQAPLYSDIEIEGEGYEIKGLPDAIIINHTNKTIQAYDVKVCRRMAMFIVNARLSRYDIQGDVYTYLIEQEILPDYPGFTVKPFKFLAIPYDEDRTPEVKQLMPGDYAIARSVWTDLLPQVEWHKDKGAWDHYPDYYKNKFISEVKLWENMSSAVVDPVLEVNMENLFS